MAISFNAPIYSEPPLDFLEFKHYPQASGSLFNTGLYQEDDLSDPSGSTLSNQSNLVDTNYTVQVITGGNFSGSIGIDLGSARSINKLTLYDVGSFGSITWSGSSDSLKAFGSADNSSWNWFEDFHPLNRELYSGSVYQISCPFNQARSYRYFKLFADKGYIKSAVGEYLPFTEIRAWVLPSVVSHSGSIDSEHSTPGGGSNTPVLK